MPQSGSPSLLLLAITIIGAVLLSLLLLLLFSKTRMIPSLSGERENMPQQETFRESVKTGAVDGATGLGGAMRGQGRTHLGGCACDGETGGGY